VDNVAWAFTTGHAANWHPLTWLSHMLDVSLFGVNPAPHHLVNVLIHLANVLLLFLLLYRWTERLGPSALAAALWAVHPQHVESVAWVAERKDVLCGLFWLLALMAYTRYVRDARGRAWAYGATVIFSACALMAKPMAVTLPCVLLLLDFWPLRRTLLFGSRSAEALHRSWIGLVVEKLPVLALSIAAGVATMAAQSRYGAVQAISDLPLHARFANAAMAYLRYLGKTFSPFDLAAIYPHPGAAMDLGVATVAAGFLVLTTIVFLALARHMPYLIVGWLWFLGTLVPVIGIVQVGSQSMADRYTYIPHIGLAIVVVWMAAAVVRPRSRWAVAIAALWLFSLTAVTYRQVEYWRDGVTLFERAIALTGPNPLARINLGTALLRTGDVDAALAQFDEAARLDPDLALAHYNRGVALRQLNRLEDARDAFATALALNPSDASAHNNLGLVRMDTGFEADAESSFRAAIEHDPELWEAYVNLGSLLARHGNLAEAERVYRRVLAAEPRHADALMNLANLCARGARADEARDLFERAIAADPNNGLAHYNLAILLQQTGDESAALKHLEEAKRLRLEND
jgi:tetratricopeptide (TPR) repeat protein